MNFVAPVPSCTPRAPPQSLMFGCILSSLLWAGAVGDTGIPAVASPAVVRTPEQLQQAITAGTAHIIVERHLNMLSAPLFNARSRLDGSVLVVSGTTSIRVRFYQNR